MNNTQEDRESGTRRNHQEKQDARKEIGEEIGKGRIGQGTNER